MASFLHLSVFGGVCAALGSLFGKLSRDSGISWIGACGLFALMITFNTIGMRNFSKSLNLSSSSLKVTLVSSAANYMSTVFIGTLLLGEETTFLWWCGTTLILCGLIIISFQEMKTKNKEGGDAESSSRKQKMKKKRH